MFHLAVRTEGDKTIHNSKSNRFISDSINGPHYNKTIVDAVKTSMMKKTNVIYTIHSYNMDIFDLKFELLLYMYAKTLMPNSKFFPKVIYQCAEKKVRSNKSDAVIHYKLRQIPYNDSPFAAIVADILQINRPKTFHLNSISYGCVR